MNDIFNLKSPYIIAHRGAKAYAPENTLSAFVLAAEQGAAAIELDAKLTRDGAVVVFHDQTLERTSNGAGRLTDKTLGYLKGLDAGSHFSSKFSGERIPKLDEVFDAVASRLLINIEITNYLTLDDSLPDRIADCVKNHGVQNRVHFSSFSTRNLVRIKKLLPECPVGYLTPPTLKGLWNNWRINLPFEAEFIHPYYLTTYAWWTRRQKYAGRRIHVWTVNSASQMRRLARLQVDGIITDDPLLAREALT